MGVGAARVRDLFKRALAYDEPTVIFIDEIDAIGAKRSAGELKANEEREQVQSSVLLCSMPCAGDIKLMTTSTY